MAAVLVPATAAQASRVCAGYNQYCGSPSYTADGGEQNNLTITQNSDRTITFSDSGATITNQTGSTCTIVDAHTATCPLRPAPTNNQSQSERIFVNVGDPNNSTNPDADVVTSNLTGFGSRDFLYLDINTGPGNDSVTGSDTNFVRDEISTGNGDDTVSARAGGDDIDDGFGFFDDFAYPSTATYTGGNNTFDGGAGDDNINGGPGTDKLTGGPGDDTITGDNFTVTQSDPQNNATITVSAPANDTIDGGDGFDTINYNLPPTFDSNGNPQPTQPGTAGAKVTLPDPGATTAGNGVNGESDTLASIEDVLGTDGADVIIGSRVSNRLFGFDGNDAIDGKAGPDELLGGGDDDTLTSADGEADRDNCGGQPGDKVNADQFDSVSDCPAPGAGTTITNVAPPNTVIPDKTPPVIRNIKAPKKIKASVLRKKGYKFTITMKDPNEVDRLIASLEARIGTKLAITSAAGYATLAEKRKSSFKGKVTMTLKIAKKLQKALKKGKGMRLFVQVTDQAGNTTPKRIKIHIT